VRHEPHRSRRYRFDCRAQCIDPFDEEPVFFVLNKIDREKPVCAGSIGAAAFRHRFVWGDYRERCGSCLTASYGLM